MNVRAAAAAIGSALLLASLAPRVLARQGASPRVAAFDEVWQTVNDTFYDPTFGGLDWDAVRRELRPRVEGASTDADSRAIIRDMLGRLGQSHFVLLTADTEADGPRGNASTPFDFRVAGDALLVVDVHPEASAAGLERGDRVLAIDGEDVSAIFAGAVASGARARDLLVWRRAANRLSGGTGTPAHLRVQSPRGDDRVVDVPRVVPEGTPVTLGNLPTMRVRFDSHEARTESGRRIGVIRFNVWMAAVAQPFADAIDRFRHADGLILDLRGNPGGLADMIRGIAGHLLAKPEVLGRMHMRNADLEFRANPRRSTADGRQVEPFAGPVAILVDGLTGSASECFTGALQSLGRARVFGTVTMGQALPASTKSLASGDVLMYAIGDFVTSTGMRLEGRGVVPDDVVPLVPGALAEGRDATWAALQWLDRVPSHP